ncbi:MAG: outer membrane lipoprotein-sorting protein [Bacteroidia bacterium]|nr:outer membrane lipoprotein-sorting protein [Bacteroidia bacterium]
MKKHNIFTSLLLASLLMLSGFTLQAQSALEIMKKVDERMRGKTAQQEMTITTVRPTWSRDMSMKSWSKGDDQSMVLLTAPVKDKGTVFLMRGKEVWNYVPSIERNIKLPPSMMMQSWMGTDFTNDDLVKQSSVVRDYDHEILKDTTLRGRTCWKIKLTPHPDAAVVWGKIHTYVDKETYIQLRSDSYDEDGYLINRMEGFDLKMMDGRMMATRMEMTPLEKPGNKTILTVKSIVFDKPIDDGFFSTQNMKVVK